MSVLETKKITKKVLLKLEKEKKRKENFLYEVEFHTKDLMHSISSFKFTIEKLFDLKIGLHCGDDIKEIEYRLNIVRIMNRVVKDKIDMIAKLIEEEKS